MGVDDVDEEVELENVELTEVSLVLEDVLPPASLVRGVDDPVPPEPAALVSEVAAPLPSVGDTCAELPYIPSAQSLVYLFIVTYRGGLSCARVASRVLSRAELALKSH